MNKILRAGAVCLAGSMLILSLAGCGKEKEDNTKEDKTPVITCKDTVITVDELNEELAFYVQYYGIDTTDTNSLNMIKEQLLTDYTNTAVQRQKAKDLGYYELTDEEKQQIEANVDEVHENWNTQVSSSVKQQNPDASEDEVTKLVEEQITQYVEQTGYTDEYMTNAETEYYLFQKLHDENTKDVSVTDEELKAAYDENLAKAQSITESDYSKIEDAVISGTAYYIPEGFRYAKHILIGLDSEKQNELITMRANTEDENAAANADAKREEYLSEIDKDLRRAYWLRSSQTAPILMSL